MSDVFAQTATRPRRSPEVAATGLTVAGGPTIRKWFAGGPQEASAARKWLLQQLPGARRHPASWLIETLGGEVIANAVRHTRSGQPDGRFEVALTQDRHWILVQVHDQGSDSEPVIRQDLEAEHGRGLQMLEALALSWGTRRTCLGRIVWFTVPTNPDV